MDAPLLAAVLDELRPLLTGRRVSRVELAGPWGVLLRFTDLATPLYFSAHPELARLGLVERPPGLDPLRRAPDALGEPLRATRLEGIEWEEGGRVARFRFLRDAEHHARLVLVAELIPRFANLVLVGDGEKILWSRREFPGAGRSREIRTGVRYVAPPPAGIPARPAETPEIPPGAGANETADRLFRDRELALGRERLRVEIRRALVRRRGKSAKALQHVERRLAEAAREPELRRRAELLAANRGNLKRGMTAISVPSFEGDGIVEIPLDPKLDGEGNVEELFRRARRLARSAVELESQRRGLEGEIAASDAAIARLGETMSDEELAAFADAELPDRRRSLERGGSERRSERGTGGRPPASTASTERGRPASYPEGFFPRRYVLPGGWVVLVGRNAAQNDVLTHKVAAPRDLWFHARGSQGSHTVLRLASGKGEPPRAVIEAAAAIAAFHSKGRNSKLVPVAYTERRHVRRPRGAPPGTAAIQREKVVFVTPAVPAGVEEENPRA